MTDWATIKARTKRALGLPAGVDDGVITDTFLLDCCNDVISEISSFSGVLSAIRTSNVTAGVQYVDLGSDCWSIDLNLVSYDTPGDGTYPVRLQFVTPEEFDRVEGLTSGTPRYFTLEPGTGVLRLRFDVPPSTSITNGLRYKARVNPARVSLDGDTVPVSQGEEGYLIVGICDKASGVLVSRGGSLSAAEYWRGRWASDQETWITERNRRLGGIRVSDVREN